MMLSLVGDILSSDCKRKRGCPESLAIGTSDVGDRPIAGECRQPPSGISPPNIRTQRQVKSETHEGDKVRLSMIEHATNMSTSVKYGI